MSKELVQDDVEYYGELFGTIFLVSNFTKPINLIDKKVDPFFILRYLGKHSCYVTCLCDNKIYTQASNIFETEKNLIIITGIIGLSAGYPTRCIVEEISIMNNYTKEDFNKCFVKNYQSGERADTMDLKSIEQ